MHTHVELLLKAQDYKQLLQVISLIERQEADMGKGREDYRTNFFSFEIAFLKVSPFKVSSK